MRRAILAGFLLALPAIAGARGIAEDYPAKALRERREGLTEVSVTIGTDGSPRDCTVIQSSGSPDLDEATCRNIYRRAHWSPATDERGKAVPSTTTMHVRWMLPR